MPHIEVYTKQNCSYCNSAKKLLRLKHQGFSEIDVEQNPAKLGEMLERSQGRRTVPEIFIDGKHVGGYEELRELANTGELDKLLGLTQ